MKKTKIICSVGPACDNVEVMEQLVLNGMNCARINLSHATDEGCRHTKEVVREVRKRTGKPIAVMYDTKGPEFRTLEFEGEGVSLMEGDIIRMKKGEIVGNREVFGVNHPEAIDSIQV